MGFLINDQLVSINGISTEYHDQVVSELDLYQDCIISIEVLRDGEVLNIETTVDENGMIGFMPMIPVISQLDDLELYTLQVEEYNFLNCFPAGYQKAVNRLGSYIDQFMLIFKPSSGAYKGMGGFGAIGSLFGANWDWERFWNLTAFLSLMLAFMNLLPIPALDGGHVVFLLYEIIVGKPAPEKVMERAQMVGMILLLGLLVFANGNDIYKLF